MTAGLGAIQTTHTADATIEALREIAAEVLRDSIMAPGERRGNSAINTTGVPLIMPGGSEQYPAMWVRDMAESCDTGLVEASTMWTHLLLMAKTQNGPRGQVLRHGYIPPWSIADHVNPDGSAVFFPGTYASDEHSVDEQGSYGRRPPIDDHYSFVHLAWCYVRQAGSAEALDEAVEGVLLWERLLHAFDAPDHDSATELCITQDNTRAVNFGFFDSVSHTDKLLFASLLRRRSARELAELAELRNDPQVHARMTRIAMMIDQHLVPTFLREDGWLTAATQRSAQPDVWGTCLALTHGALPDAARQPVLDTLLSALDRNTITDESAAVRHVPIDCDAAATSAWESCCCVHGTYQNGGYWHTATGWLIQAVRLRDQERAEELLMRFMNHLETHRDAGGPWEWRSGGGVGHNPRYLTSVTVPLGVLSPVVELMA